MRTMILAWAVLVAAPSCFANEQDVREEVTATVARALAEDRYADLEAMHGAYLRGKETTPAGTSKLGLFYLGLVKASNYASSDERFWSDKDQRFRRWLERHPQSPAARNALAKALIGRAWQIRGKRFASETPEANWAPFLKQIDAARVYLEQVKPVAGADPEWYSCMLQVAIAQGWKYTQVQALIDELMKLDPDYRPFHYWVLEYLTPKWYGSNSMIDRYAAWLADRTQALNGQSAYAYVYWHVADRYYGVRLFKEMKIDWPRMRTGFDQIIARYPDPWNINKYARFACLAKDYDTAASLLKRIDQPMSDVWGNGKVLDPCLRAIERRMPNRPASVRPVA